MHFSAIEKGGCSMAVAATKQVPALANVIQTWLGNRDVTQFNGTSSLDNVPFYLESILYIMELSLSIRFCILGTIPYSYNVLYSWLRSVFLAAFRGLLFVFGLFLSSELRPASVRNNGIMKTATFGSSAEKKGKELLGSGHISLISKPFCMLPTVV